MKSTITNHQASFRDPSGFMFLHEGLWFRAVQKFYQKEYDALVANGLLQQLIAQGKWIAHEEVSLPSVSDQHYKTLLPAQIAFQTYPYEWSFHQLQDAALLTLDLCIEGMQMGMILKDATAYNVYFKGVQPVFLDSLSFQFYEPEKGWVAFQRFCRHFLYPLLLMKEAPLMKPLMLLAYPDGLDVQTFLQLCPNLSKLNLNNWLYTFLPAKVKGGNSKKNLSIAQEKQLDNLKHLRQYVASIKQKNAHTVWEDYYDTTILSDQYLQAKKEKVHEILAAANLQTLVDLGANEGAFSKVAAAQVAQVIACDFDTACIDKMYVQVKQEGIKNITPFINDLLQPTPATGWMHEEHYSFTQRVNADGVMALALVHHLRIANNVPWQKIFQLLHGIAPHWALVEFVPKEDEKVQQLLATRTDIFTDYSEQEFVACAQAFYHQLKRIEVPNSTRVLFVMSN